MVSIFSGHRIKTVTTAGIDQLVGFKKIALLVLLTASFNLTAKDLGVIGKTYPIKEKDMIEAMKEVAAEKIANGDLEQLNREMEETGKQYVKTPPGTFLPRATEYRATEINPVYKLLEDITDANGKVIFKAGVEVNPLEVKPLGKTLCFIDGNDPEQVEWLLKYCTDSSLNKLILINGNYAEISEKHNIRLYFDQRGFLIKRFNIQAVPAVIRQSGLVLYVEEFPII